MSPCGGENEGCSWWASDTNTHPRTSPGQLWPTALPFSASRMRMKCKILCEQFQDLKMCKGCSSSILSLSPPWQCDVPRPHPSGRAQRTVGPSLFLVPCTTWPLHNPGVPLLHMHVTHPLTWTSEAASSGGKAMSTPQSTPDFWVHFYLNVYIYLLIPHISEIT